MTVARWIRACSVVPCFLLAACGRTQHDAPHDAAADAVETTLAPMPVPDVRVFAGMGSTCMTFPSPRTSRCWGGAETAPPAYVFPQGDFSSYSISLSRACALDRRGDVHCSFAGMTHHAPASLLTGIDRMALDTNYLCTLKRGSGLRQCWAVTYAPSSGPPAPSTARWLDVAGALSSMCFLSPDGRASCEPRALEGIASPIERLRPGSLAAAPHSVCGITDHGDGVCWGKRNPNVPERVPGPLARVSPVQNGFCALRVDGTIWCSRKEILAGEFGNAPRLPAPNPMPLFKDFVLSDHHACGVTLDDRVVCWGGNRSGEATVPEDLR